MHRALIICLLLVGTPPACAPAAAVVATHVLDYSMPIFSTLDFVSDMLVAVEYYKDVAEQDEQPVFFLISCCIMMVACVAGWVYFLRRFGKDVRENIEVVVGHCMDTRTSLGSCTVRVCTCTLAILLLPCGMFLHTLTWLLQRVSMVNGDEEQIEMPLSLACPPVPPESDDAEAFHDFKRDLKTWTLHQYLPYIEERGRKHTQRLRDRRRQHAPFIFEASFESRPQALLQTVVFARKMVRMAGRAGRAVWLEASSLALSVGWDMIRAAMWSGVDTPLPVSLHWFFVAAGCSDLASAYYTVATLAKGTDEVAMMYYTSVSVILYSLFILSTVVAIEWMTVRDMVRHNISFWRGFSVQPCILLLLLLYHASVAMIMVPLTVLLVLTSRISWLYTYLEGWLGCGRWVGCFDLFNKAIFRGEPLLDGLMPNLPGLLVERRLRSQAFAFYMAGSDRKARLRALNLELEEHFQRALNLELEEHFQPRDASADLDIGKVDRLFFLVGVHSLVSALYPTLSMIQEFRLEAHSSLLDAIRANSLQVSCYLVHALCFVAALCLYMKMGRHYFGFFLGFKYYRADARRWWFERDEQVTEFMQLAVGRHADCLDIESARNHHLFHAREGGHKTCRCICCCCRAREDSLMYRMHPICQLNAVPPVVQGLGQDVQAQWNQKVEDLAHRGFTLGSLLYFYSQLGPHGSVMQHFDPCVSTTNDVVRQAIIPLSLVGGLQAIASGREGTSGKAYAQVMEEDNPTLPSRMVSHGWGNRFSHLVAAIVADAMEVSSFDEILGSLTSSQLPNLITRLGYLGKLDLKYWVCSFSVNQHSCICGGFGPSPSTHSPRFAAWDQKRCDRVTGEVYRTCGCSTEKHFNDHPGLCELNKFDSMMEYLTRHVDDVRQVIVVDDEFDVFNRAWVVAELILARNLNMPQRLKIRSKACLQRLPVLSRKGIDVRNCEATRDEDRREILSKIKNIDEFNRDLNSLVFSAEDSLFTKCQRELCRDQERLEQVGSVLCQVVNSLV